MSIIAIAVKHLVAAGVTGDALVTAIAEMESQIDTRSAGAIRQERYRRNKASQNVTGVTGDALPLDGSNGFSDSSLTSLNPHKEKTPKGVQKKAPHVTPPDWLPLAEWEGFKEMRVKIKKPMTDRAQKLAIGKLEKFRAMGHDPTEILNQSILNDYQDLYQPKENYENPSRINGKPFGKPNKSGAVGKSEWTSAAEQIIAEDRARAAELRK